MKDGRPEVRFQSEVENMKKLVTRETSRRPQPIEEGQLDKIQGGGDPDIPTGGNKGEA